MQLCLRKKQVIRRYSYHILFLLVWEPFLTADCTSRKLTHKILQDFHLPCTAAEIIVQVEFFALIPSLLIGLSCRQKSVTDTPSESRDVQKSESIRLRVHTRKLCESHGSSYALFKAFCLEVSCESSANQLHSSLQQLLYQIYQPLHAASQLNFARASDLNSDELKAVRAALKHIHFLAHCCRGDAIDSEKRLDDESMQLILHCLAVPLTHLDLTSIHSWLHAFESTLLTNAYSTVGKFKSLCSRLSLKLIAS